MNLTELSTAVKRYGFDDSDPLTTWINAAIHDLERAADWDFLEVVANIVMAAEDTTVELPTNYLYPIKLKDITDSEWIDLEYWDARRWFREVENQAVGGSKPEVFTTMAGTLEVWPTYSATRTLRLFYRKLVVDLVNPLDSPSEFPVGIHYLIVLRAAAIALMAENEEDRSATADTQYETGVMRSIERYGIRQTGEPEQVQDTAQYA